MMDFNNTRDVERESVLSLLNYSQIMPNGADSETGPDLIPISGVNVQPVQSAGLPALLISSIYKLAASLSTDSAYDGGGIGGTGHVTDNDLSRHNAADFIVANAYQGGGIGGSGNAPDDAEFRRSHVSQLDMLVNDVAEPGGIGGTGHADDDAVFPQEVTGIVALADTGGGIGGSGHTPDILTTDTLAGVASGDVVYNLPPAAVASQSRPVVISDSANFINITDVAQVVIDPTIGGVDVQQQWADTMLPDNQSDVVPEEQPETIASVASENTLTVDNLLFDETQLLTNDSDADVVMESENSLTSTLPVFVYESLNDLNQEPSQSVIC
jgi:hypothetical protein